MFNDLSEWLVTFTDSDWAIIVLFINSFTESIFFPIPPDLLLIGIGILQPHLAIWLGVIVTIASVAGALVGHGLGGKFGRPILFKLFKANKILAVERMLDKYGVWATVLAAFTPIPYKVFAIAAGTLSLNRRTFLIASLIGRGARFISIGALIYLFGETIEDSIVEHFETYTIGLGIGLAVVIGGWALIRHFSHNSFKN